MSKKWRVYLSVSYHANERHAERIKLELLSNFNVEVYQWQDGLTESRNIDRMIDYDCMIIIPPEGSIMECYTHVGMGQYNEIFNQFKHNYSYEEQRWLHNGCYIAEESPNDPLSISEITWHEKIDENHVLQNAQDYYCKISHCDEFIYAGNILPMKEQKTGRAEREISTSEPVITIMDPRLMTPKMRSKLLVAKKRLII